MSFASLEKSKIFTEQLQFVHLLAGTTGGVLATVLFHPLDVIKIRLAVYDGKYKLTPKYGGIYNAFKTILHTEGVQGLYRGIVPNVWGAGTSWGLYFLLYNYMKSTLRKGDLNIRLQPTEHLVTAAGAGLMTLAITNPIWVIKTRMFLQFNEKTIRYKGIIDAFVQIYRIEGIRGYYKGFLPGMLGVSHGAVQFMVYEEMKYRYNVYNNLPIYSKLENTQNLCFAAVSKIIAACVTYPYQVVRARLQNQHYAYSGIYECIQLMWTYEGWRGFYKGLTANILRVTPATVVTFLVYENIFHFYADK